MGKPSKELLARMAAEPEDYAAQSPPDTRLAAVVRDELTRLGLGRAPTDDGRWTRHADAQE